MELYLDTSDVVAVKALSRIFRMVMELYLDTSDVVAVKALSRIFPLAGVTTNPSIIAAGKKPLEVVLPQLHEAMGGQGRLFAQVMATTAEGMVNDARKLRSIIADKKPLEVVLPQLHEAMGGQGRLFAQVMATTAEGMVNDARKLRSIIADIVVKVPVTAEGLATIKMLKAEGIPTLGTAVYGAAQGLLSALAGAEYVAPYVNRIDAQGGSGIQTVTDLHQLLKMHAPQAKVRL